MLKNYPLKIYQSHNFQMNDKLHKLFKANIGKKRGREMFFKIIYKPKKNSFQVHEKSFLLNKQLLLHRSDYKFASTVKLVFFFRASRFIGWFTRTSVCKLRFTITFSGQSVFVNAVLY